MIVQSEQSDRKFIKHAPLARRIVLHSTDSNVVKVNWLEREAKNSISYEWNELIDNEKKMQLKSNNSMLSSTKSIDMASTTSTLSIKTNIERTADGRFVVKKANSLDDEYSSEAISTCSENDDKIFATIKNHLASEKCQNSSIDDVAFDDETCYESDPDSMLDNFDVTLVDDVDCCIPKNDAERMFCEVVEVLRYEQEVKERSMKVN